MEIFDQFKITQRHYDKLIKQGYDNLPYETGGFLGGKNGVICAIMPTFNKDWDTTTDTFKIDDGDILRAHTFFQKHNLKYFSVYHTHPKGVAYPSEADINTGHKYHFIISYQDKENPQFNAFRIDDRKPIQLPFKVISNKGFSAVDLTDKSNNPEAIAERKEVSDLTDRISNIVKGEKNIYDKLPPKEGELNSGFSTFA